MEIWLLIITAIKVAILLPNYFIREINFLFLVFMINSATTFWLSHLLHIRGCIIHEKPKSSVRFFQCLLTARIVLLLALYFSAPVVQYFFSEYTHDSDEYFLRCDIDKHEYPYEFLMIFFLDALSASIDLAIFLVSPKMHNKQKRLREARTADIEATCEKKN